MKMISKTQQAPPHCFSRFSSRILLALAVPFLGGCSAMVAHPTPTASWTQRSGQVKFSSANANVVGDIVIRHDADHFLAEITKAPGVKLLTISAEFGTGPEKVLAERHARRVKISGPLAGGTWVFRPQSLAKGKGSDDSEFKDSAKVWAALPEVFEWAQAQAKGGEFRVCFPDIVMHSKTDGGEVQRFDYKRLDNPNKVASLGELAPKDRKKLPAIETVVCHLDK